MSVTSKNILNSSSSTFAIAGTEGDVAEFIQSAVGRVVSQYSAASTYEVGEIVRHEGHVYKCTTAIASPESWTQAHWTAATDADIAARLKMLKSDGFATDAFAADILEKPVANIKANSSAFAPEYDATESYSVGQFVWRQGDIYQCVSAATGAWDSTKWEMRKLDDFFKESNSLLMRTMAIPFASLPADNTTSSYKRFRVTVTDDMTIVLHTPTSGEAEIFECRFDGSGLTADKSISFSTSGATATTMDTDCGTVKAGKIALMSAFWNGSTWDVNWKVEG